MSFVLFSLAVIFITSAVASILF